MGIGGPLTFHENLKAIIRDSDMQQVTVIYDKSRDTTFCRGLLVRSQVYEHNPWTFTINYNTLFSGWLPHSQILRSFSILLVATSN